MTRPYAMLAIACIYGLVELAARWLHRRPRLPPPDRRTISWQRDWQDNHRREAQS
jgi:hypothetical protein